MKIIRSIVQISVTNEMKNFIEIIDLQWIYKFGWYIYNVLI